MYYTQIIMVLSQKSMQVSLFSRSEVDNTTISISVFDYKYFAVFFCN